MVRNNFVFLDTQGNRWRRFRFFFAVGFSIFFICLVLFVKSLIVSPRLSRLQQMSSISNTLKAMHDGRIHQPPVRLPPEWLKTGIRKNTVAPIKPPDHEHAGKVCLGFYSGWDPTSFASLEQNGSKLTHIAPEWFSLTGTPAELSAVPDRPVRLFAKKHDILFMPQLTNLKGTWHAEAVETLARAGAERQQQFCQQLVQELKDLDAAGVVVDLEDVDPEYRDMLTGLISEIGHWLHSEDLELWLCIPVGNDIKVFDLESLSAVVDRFVALLYDENGENDAPGPIASPAWFCQWLDVLTAYGSPDQWIIGIGAYGYDWQDGLPAKTVSFVDSMSRAGHAGEGALDDEGQPVMPGPHFTYRESDQTHTIWFLDAVTFYNQKKLAETKKAGGIAIYRLGAEDPALWQAAAWDTSFLPAAFETITSADIPAHIGDGDFITAFNERADGRRNITIDDKGVWHARYVSYPRYPLLYHRGQGAGEQVAITFDDGPDPEWTPQILDILKSQGVQAAFFVTGINAARYPDLIKRIIAEGHELGNHTYSHMDIAGMPAAMVRLELNATQRIIEGITGQSTILFRPPYNADRQPGSFEEFEPLLIANELGYVTVSQSIDSEDWNATGPELILQRIRERRNEGNVILLHDAGGDRSATVTILPALIDYLCRRGDRLVGLHRLIDIPRESLMPPIPSTDVAEDRLIAHTGFHLMHVIEQLCWAFMIVSTALLLCRTVVLLFLAARNRKRQERRTVMRGDQPQPVSVLIAAHNEAKVITATLASVLATGYPGDIEVIVVDDGSTDETAACVLKAAAADSRVKLIRQEKQGKAAALDKALTAAVHELIVMLDADTQFAPETISALVRCLDDPKVAAVSGHARVGNDDTWVTRFQSLEYTCGFNLDRRAYDEWNCVTVVPGAVSAFRRTAVCEAGGLSADTLAEDTDLTLMLHRLGYRVCYAPDAIAFTEAPDTIAGLVRQRTRWAFGTLQCLCKHHDLLFTRKNKFLGFFSLPCIWFFHFFLVALMPFVDAFLVFSVATGSGAAIMDYALAFLMMDLITAVAACRMDRERIGRAWLILPMRLLYRPILAWAVWKAIIRALRGAWVAWGRQERRGALVLTCSGR